MISVIIPALNAAARFPACLDALIGGAVDGLVKEVIVTDGGSVDETMKIADEFGAKLLDAPPGRGGQLRMGAAAAKAKWLLFLHADTVLEEAWAEEAATFIASGQDRAGVFTLRFDRAGLAPRLVAAGAMVRTKLLKSPYGDQGLLISRRLYDDIGGFADLPLMEDVEFTGRLIKAKGRHALHVFRAGAVTSADRYERDGYIKRVLKNAITLARFHLGVAPERLAESYRK